MRTVARIDPRQGGGGGQKAGMPAHDHVNLDTRQRPVVAVAAHDGTSDKLGGTAEAGGMVVFEQVVINRLWDMETAARVIDLAGMLVDDMGRFGRIVPANVKEITNIVFQHNAENLEAFLVGGFLAHTAQGRGWRRRNRFQVGLGFLAQVYHVLIQHALDSMQGAINTLDFLVPLGFLDGAYQAPVDDH